MATPVGEVTVKVVPDLSGIKPAVRAELDRIGAAIRVGETAVEELAAVLHDEILPRHAPIDNMHVAAKLLQRFVIIPRKDTDASES